MSLERVSKRVFITGIEGFTGRYLSRYLKERGYEVAGSSYSGENAQYRVDICDRDSIDSALSDFKPNYLIHLAAISFVAHGNREDFYKINTIGTENVIEASIKASIDRVIIASSAAVYGRREESVLDESLCPYPSNHYGASKYSAERVASNYFNQCSILITRPFNYTGVGQEEHFLIPKIIKHYATRKKRIELGNLDVIREFNDIDFVCNCYEKLINSTKDSITVNICSGRGIALMDIIKIMNEIAGYEIEVRVNPKFVRKDEIKKVVGSPKLLRDIVGDIHPKPLKDMLREMYKGYIS